MHVVAGTMDRERLVSMSRQAIRSPGVCSGMGTANSMHIATEALGMALPGTAPVAAMSPKMKADAARAGERIVQMVWDDLKPRDILTAGAFSNAVQTVLAVGGSVNCIKHLQAVATEADSGVDVYALFERLSPQVPVVVAVRPVGEHSIEALQAAGGCRGVLKALAERLDRQVLGVSGQTLETVLAQTGPPDAEVIRPLSQPFATLPAIVMLRGNVCPDTGIVKAGIAPRQSRRFTGPARCFDTADAAIAAIRDGSVQRGDVMVMRGAGAKGGPAMGGGASRVVFALDGAGLGADVALLTDGHLSGLVCKGLVVAEVSPEAAVGGPLALLRDGDAITIDLDTRRCDAALDDAQWAARRSTWQSAPPAFDRGWLALYRRNVGNTASGAVVR